MNIVYKNFEEDDIENIITFWNENSGWETDLSRDEFNLRFCSSPFGEPVIMLAIDSDLNEIAGFCCFLAAYVSVDGKESKCYRPFGAIIKESVRKNFSLASFLKGNHPILQLYREGARKAKEKNADFIYLIPDPRWKKLASVMKFQTCRFPLLSYKLFSRNLKLEEETKIENLNSQSECIDQLWAQSDKTNLCTIRRDSKFYEWKINLRHGLYKLKAVYYKNKLTGIFTLHFKPESFQWTIGDVLTTDKSIELTRLINVARYAVEIEYKRENPDNTKEYKAGILATPLIEERAIPLGYYKDNYDFTLAVQSLNKNDFTKSDIAPEKWFIGATD